MDNLKIIIGDKPNRFRIEADGKNMGEVKGVQLNYEDGGQPVVSLTYKPKNVEVQLSKPKVKEKNDG